MHAEKMFAHWRPSYSTDCIESCKLKCGSPKKIIFKLSEGVCGNEF